MLPESSCDSRVNHVVGDDPTVRSLPRRSGRVRHLPKRLVADVCELIKNHELENKQHAMLVEALVAETPEMILNPFNECTSNTRKSSEFTLCSYMEVGYAP